MVRADSRAQKMGSSQLDFITLLRLAESHFRCFFVVIAFTNNQNCKLDRLIFIDKSKNVQAPTEGTCIPQTFI